MLIPSSCPMQAVTAGWDQLWAATPSSLYCLTMSSGEPSSRATAEPAQSSGEPSSSATAEPAKSSGEPSSSATAEPAQSCVCLSLPGVIGGAADARVHLLAAGGKHVVAVTSSGQCFSWGALLGLLAQGCTSERPHPKLQPQPSGDGALGQLGHGGRDHVSTPRHLPVSEAPATRVSALACGSLHTLLLGSDDVVYACGHSLYGQVRTQHTAPWTCVRSTLCS